MMSSSFVLNRRIKNDLGKGVFDDDIIYDKAMEIASIQLDDDIDGTSVHLRAEVVLNHKAYGGTLICAFARAKLAPRQRLI